jgi:V/A-type H+-transporting ATPase subunit I
VILAMTKLRILGPRERLGEVVRALQDVGVLHLAEPRADEPALRAAALAPAEQRERRRLGAAAEDAARALAALNVGPGLPPRARPAVTRAEIARGVRLAWRVRRAAERLQARDTAIAEERALILKYQHFFAAFRTLLEAEDRWPNATVYHVLLRGTDPDALRRLRASLAEVIGDAFELYSQPLATGELALLIVVAAPAVGQVEQLLARARVEEIPVPAAYGGGSLAQAIPRMLARLAALPREAATVRRERERLVAAHAAALRRARAAFQDRLRELDALPHAGVTARAFVIEGWVPSGARAALEERLAPAFGDTVAVSDIAREEWRSEEAPVVLTNPRLFRPFELLIRLLPLPRYGTIDPTPFVAVFFPAFFGLIVGDVGYGLLLAALGLVLHARSRPGTTLRSVAEIIGPCALLTIVAGFLYGEVFGQVVAARLGLRPLLLDRAEALIPFLLLAVGLGVVHVVIGFGLGVVASLRRGETRHALGRGVSGLMLLLIVLALLAAVGALPHLLLTPAAIALLVAFPLLVLLEGVVAPIELLSAIGNVLSYARIMALGVASVMLAVVANRMHGAFGSAVVGVVFALLFHLVNFAIALFSPTIHALRLHYVEFFGKFYSPGGVRYQPFGHWAGEPAR